MSFKDNNKAKDHLGNLVRFTPNTKGTGTPHIPSTIALRDKDYVLPAESNPDSDANRQPSRFDENPPGDVGKTQKVVNTFTQNKFMLPLLPDGSKDRSTRRVAPKRNLSN